MNTLVSSELIEEVQTNEIEVRYAFASSQDRNWFIRKNKTGGIIPKGYKLIFILDCIKTNRLISIKDTYPTIGDVICDTDGDFLEIVNTK